MKNRIHKNTSILVAAFFMLMLLGTQQSHAQLAVIDSQSFNASYPNWPTGWSADTGGWFMDTSTSNASYGPTAGEFGYPGASSGAMIDVDNSITTTTGYYSVTSASYSTIGLDSITIIYGARLTKKFNNSGSKIQNLSWSSNGGTTWDSLPYVESFNDSYWHLINDSTPIKLPAAASNQSSIIFRWLAYIVPNASGTYRIDDVIVAGDTIAKDTTSGITTVNTVSPVSLFPNPATDFVTINNPTGKNYTMRLTDVTGKILKTAYTSTAENRVDVSDVAPGFYMAQLIDSDNNSQSQVIKLVIIR